jgi:hypothetical protein
MADSTSDKVAALEAKVQAAEKFVRKGRKALNDAGKGTYRENQRAIMRARRLAEMEIQVPLPENPDRRALALSAPEKFNETYFGDRFFCANAAHHDVMMADICHIAQYGGDKAIAAPRGEGKTTHATCALIYAILKEWVKFPVIVAQTGPHAARIFKDMKYQFEANDLLAADFPEICAPVRALEGAPQRGRTQRHDGTNTRIEWTADHVVFPYVKGSNYAGVKIAFYGLDAAIRGIVVNGDRPDFVLIDDPETRESAASPHQIAIRAQTIDRDIGGLAGPTKRISRVMLCTIQNRFCIAYQYTDKRQKPSWDGRRFRMLNKWPDNHEMWEEYCHNRALAQQDGDPEARAATQFYLDNFEEMNRGAEVSNPARFDSIVMADGWRIEVDALQACYNIIADFGMDAFLAEYQNEPPEESGPEGSGLTAHGVMTSENQYPRLKLPPEVEFTTAAIDIGKYACHWCVIAWLSDATALVIDYGVQEVAGMGAKTERQAQELAIFNALLSFRAYLMDMEMAPTVCLVDSGDFTEVVYSFIRDVGGAPFMAAKGSAGRQWNPQVATPHRRVGENWYTNHLQDRGIWLYTLNTDYWKEFVHQRFLTPHIDETGALRPAAMSLYNSEGDRKRHMSFAHHIVAEERREEFIAGKGMKRWWHQTNRNNHWLDAVYMACAAAGMIGMRLPIGDNSAPYRHKTGGKKARSNNIYGKNPSYFKRHGEQTNG